MKTRDQIAAETWAELETKRLTNPKNITVDACLGKAIIKAAIEKTTEILQNQLAAIQVELDGADKVIANYKRWEAMTKEVRKLWTPDESRAAHAGERSKESQDLCRRLHGQTLHGQAAAHASEQSDDLIDLFCPRCDQRLEKREQSDDTKRRRGWIHAGWMEKEPCKTCKDMIFVVESDAAMQAKEPK